MSLRELLNVLIVKGLLCMVSSRHSPDYWRGYFAALRNVQKACPVRDAVVATRAVTGATDQIATTL